MAERDWQAWVKKHANNIWRVVIVLLFLLLAVWALSLSHFNLVIAHSEPWLWLTNALIQVGPELAGIAIGVVTIDYLNEWRQREQLKAQLIRQMSMNIRDVAVPAARELAHHGLLSDGSLSGSRLDGADLSGAVLVRANLIGANLRRANLSGSDLGDANLSGAALTDADLSRADLTDADLSRADLVLANLSRADLWKANLSRADLGYANLSRADLWGADLSRAYLRGADLGGADLGKADLSGAALWEANLSGARNWTIKQLEQAKTLELAIMPDEVQLGGVDLDGSTIEGPTFEAWKEQFLAKSTTERAEAGWVDAEDTEPTEDV